MAEDRPREADSLSPPPSRFCSPSGRDTAPQDPPASALVTMAGLSDFLRAEARRWPKTVRVSVMGVEGGIGGEEVAFPPRRGGAAGLLASLKVRGREGIDQQALEPRSNWPSLDRAGGGDAGAGPPPSLPQGPSLPPAGPFFWHRPSSWARGPRPSSSPEELPDPRFPAGFGV